MNKNIPKGLQDAIVTNRLVIFVGSGTSLKFGFPNWNSLVNNIIDDISEPSLFPFKDLLETDTISPLQVLAILEKGHKTVSLRTLEKIFKKIPVNADLSLHKKLIQLSSKIITTNYDTAFENADEDLYLVPQFDSYKVAELKNHSKYLFKIHGCISSPSNCILFETDYKKLYKNSNELAAIFALKNIIVDNTILFVGFSLNDIYISELLKSVIEMQDGFSNKHYMLSTEDFKEFEDSICTIKLESYNQLDEVLQNLISFRVPSPKNETYAANLDANHINRSLYRSDIPPTNPKWVGREKEIENIHLDIYKAVIITGIGGQGKSGLASHYIKNVIEHDLAWEYWDWRDCKEETNLIHSKVLSIIERITDGQIKPEQLQNEDFNSLLDIFFDNLGQRKIVFVFDNVDSYVDYQNFNFTRGVAKIFNKAVTYPHQSKFIFTCRPEIKEVSVGLIQIKLHGLSLLETSKLFKSYSISLSDVEINSLAQTVQDLTKGHPYWANLIAAQALIGKDALKLFLDNIRRKSTSNWNDDESTVLAQKILNTVWEVLNNNQKVFLRGVAETVRAERQDNLFKILGSELNYNQFSKALKNLKNLNLLIIKSTSNEPDLFELHPLVKEYVRQRHGRNERNKYITLIVTLYNNILFSLKPKINKSQPLEFFENWLAHVELEINREEYKTALVSLQEITNAILAAGYIGEYVRISFMLFLNIDWAKAIEEEYIYFNIQFFDFIRALVHLGRYDEALSFLKKYEKHLKDKSLNYIHLCEMQCYLNWYKGKYAEAIRWGEEGVDLRKSSNASNLIADIDNTLSLALRDSRVKANIERALNSMLEGEDIEELLSNIDNIDRVGEFFGNIGRCLHFMLEYDKALIFYKRSFVLLDKSETSNLLINKAYACQWIGECLVDADRIQESLPFIALAAALWKKVSPPKEKGLYNLIKDKSLEIIIEPFYEKMEKDIEYDCWKWLELKN